LCRRTHTLPGDPTRRKFLMHGTHTMCLLQTNCQVIQPAGSFICAGELIRCQVSNPREVLFGQANSYAARYVRPKPEIIRDLFRVRPAEYCQVTLSISARDNPRSLPGTFGRSQRQPAVSQVTFQRRNTFHPCGQETTYFLFILWTSLL
jgi:hypothetical protein